MLTGCASDASQELTRSMRARTVLVFSGLQIAHAYRSPNRIVTVKHGVKFALGVIVIGPEILAGLDTTATLEAEDFNPTPFTLPRYQSDWAVFAPIGAGPAEWGKWSRHGTTDGKVYISTALGIAQGKFIEEIGFQDSPASMMIISDNRQLGPGSSGAPVFNAQGDIIGLVRGRLGGKDSPGMIAVQPFREIAEAE
jgi:hypothetical protein